jgi:hypothetical protein
VAEKDALYSVVGSVGLMMLEGFPDVWDIIMLWYWEVSMMTVALPLSAGSMVMSGVFFRSCRALASSLVMLWVWGGLGCAPWCCVGLRLLVCWGRWRWWLARWR